MNICLAVWWGMHTALSILAVAILVTWLVLRHRRVKLEGPPSKDEKARHELTGCLAFIGFLLFCGLMAIAAAVGGLAEEVDDVRRQLDRIESNVKRIELTEPGGP